MAIKVEFWKIQDVINKWERLDPKPQYQRSSVWNEKRKKLLIDSIFEDFDIPKFYFNQLNNNQFFDYEVADGQQRLRAIYEFYNNTYSATKASTESNSFENVFFRDLNIDLQNKFLNTILTITTLQNVTTEKVREIFSRLQMGVSLNQAELRKAIASNIGFFVQSVIQNHLFFKNCGIIDARNKHQDYIDHSICFLHHGFLKDMKGAILKDVYIELSAIDSGDLIKNVSDTLTLMNKVNNYKIGIFKNKWAFLDTFIFLSKNMTEKNKFNAKKYFDLFIGFERKRLASNREPEKLIESGVASESDKRLYAYIIAFKTGGALKGNLEIRSNIFDEEFNYTIT